MIDYADRIEQVHLTLETMYGVTDRQATEILLAAALPCKLPYPWFILETSYYQLSPVGAWFNSLGANCVTLSSLRTVRPRDSNEKAAEVLAKRDKPYTFIENIWEMPPSIKWRFHLWPYITQECIKVRSEYPRTKLIEPRAEQLLCAAVSDVREMEWRDEGLIKMPQMPPQLPYYAELLQRLSPDVRSFDVLVRNLTALAGRRACLFNRDVDSTDWQAVSRVMRDTVPLWVINILSHIGMHNNILLLKSYLPLDVVKTELGRMVSDGLLYANGHQWYIREPEEKGRDMGNILAGKVF